MARPTSSIPTLRREFQTLPLRAVAAGARQRRVAYRRTRGRHVDRRRGRRVAAHAGHAPHRGHRRPRPHGQRHGHRALAVAASGRGLDCLGPVGQSERLFAPCGMIGGRRATQGPAHPTPMAQTDARFNWSDPLLLDQQLTDEERMVRDTARDYCPGEAGAARARDVPAARSPTRRSSARWARSTCSASSSPSSTAAPAWATSATAWWRARSSASTPASAR